LATWASNIIRDGCSSASELAIALLSPAGRRKRFRTGTRTRRHRGYALPTSPRLANHRRLRLAGGPTPPVALDVLRKYPRGLLHGAADFVANDTPNCLRPFRGKFTMSNIACALAVRNVAHTRLRRARRS
jgi:hypothetical protein